MSHIKGSIVLQPTKKTGNYMICEKNGDVRKKISFQINNVFFPFGKEDYNDNTIINLQLDDATNYTKNVIFDLLKITNIFEKMKSDSNVAMRYNIIDKSFFNFIKKNETEQDKPNSYIVRTYMKYGAMMTQLRHVGQLDRTFDIKGKYGNVTIELGSMWVSNTTKQYGVNLYVSNIVVH